MFFRYMVGLRQIIVVALWVMSCGLIASESSHARFLRFLPKDVCGVIVSSGMTYNDVSSLRPVSKDLNFLFDHSCVKLATREREALSGLINEHEAVKSEFAFKNKQYIRLLSFDKKIKDANFDTNYWNNAEKAYHQELSVILPQVDCLPLLEDNLLCFLDSEINLMKSIFCKGPLKDFWVEKAWRCFFYQGSQAGARLDSVFEGIMALMRSDQDFLSKINSKFEIDGSHGFPIMDAYEKGYFFDELLVSDNLDLNVHNKDGDTLLHLIMRKKDINALSKLYELNKNFNLFAKNNNDQSPMDIFYTHFFGLPGEFLSPLILEKNADVLKALEDKEKSEQGRLELIKKELEKRDEELAKQKKFNQEQKKQVEVEKDELLKKQKVEEVHKKMFFKKILCVSALLNVSFLSFFLYHYFLHYA